MRFAAAQKRGKLSKLIEIEGYDSIEQLAQTILSDSVSPAICMNEDCDFTCEMRRRLLRRVPRQLNAIRSHPRWPHLTAEHRPTTLGPFLLLNFQLQAPAPTRRIRMKNGKKRKAWTSVQLRDLKTMARKKTPAGRIAKKLKRSEGATRQKAFSIGLSLDSR